jgi:hypothetical protein
MPLRIFRIVNDGGGTMWGVDDPVACRRYTVDGSGAAVGPYHQDPDPDPLVALCNAWVGSRVVEPKHGRGEYFPRMWRPHDSPHVFDTYFDVWRAAVQAGRVVIDRLAQALRYIEPDPKQTFEAYGHEVRQLLILACTEVEAGWKGVLRANGYTAPIAKGKRRPRSLTRSDYVKLAAPMHLHEWSVTLPMYRKVSTFTPFGGWATTGQLDWYDAYNAVKHDSEAEFHQATLRHALHACGALFVMVLAQFGTWREYRGPVGPFSSFGDGTTTLFAVDSAPAWPPEELYVPPMVIRDGTVWHPKNYPF